MNWKKLGKTILFPHIVLLILLLPVATIWLTYAMLYWGESAPERIASYVAAAYTLTVWCARMPAIIRFFKKIKKENKYIRIWTDDARLRVNASLIGAFIINVSYAVLQLGLGIYHKSFWFYSLAGYYFSLALMRFFLMRHTRKHEPGEKMREELSRYRVCGWIFLGMNMTLSVMIFYMVYKNRIVKHHEITTISMAAYTFFTFTKAIINVVRYRRYNSPVFSASKAISLAAACVSMLTLEGTMLVTFSDGTMKPLVQRMFLGFSGGAISIFIIAMAIYMIVQSSKKMAALKQEEK